MLSKTFVWKFSALSTWTALVFKNFNAFNNFTGKTQCSLIKWCKTGEYKSSVWKMGVKSNYQFGPLAMIMNKQVAEPVRLIRCADPQKTQNQIVVWSKKIGFGTYVHNATVSRNHPAPNSNLTPLTQFLICKWPYCTSEWIPRRATLKFCANSGLIFDNPWRACPRLMCLFGGGILIQTSDTGCRRNRTPINTVASRRLKQDDN